MEAAYNKVQTGEIVIDEFGSARQLPELFARLIQIKASYDNLERVYIGGNINVTQEQNTDTDFTGISLAPGETTDLMPVANLSTFFLVGNAYDKITYLLIG